MKVDCAHDELVEIHKLIPNPRNNNRHSIEQIQTLAKIIDFQGMRSPIVVSKQSGFVVKGHCRLEALRTLGWKEVPVNFQSYSSPAQEFADLTADNQIARQSELDFHQLKVDLEELNFDLDTTLLGIDGLDLAPIEPPERKPPTEKQEKLCQHCGGIL